MAGRSIGSQCCIHTLQCMQWFITMMIHSGIEAIVHVCMCPFLKTLYMLWRLHTNLCN